MIHFDRSIHRAAGTQWSAQSGHAEMQALRTAPTAEAFDGALTVLLRM
jgi:hypothetical protein